ncbi:YopX family protein [Lactiplantibacillus plantarum]|uniref:YopX family protein n=1 Tax=Lactiplantibacillus plantarum TaxID=1590 RepID=UPI0027A3BDFA|nr:YopX family protein [Lactiplantibacillus plantarum]
MIKFRAWDKVQKVMMVPRDIQTDSDGNIFYVEAMGPDGEYDEGDLDVFKLEQFTGLTDVNGKDIYEGDIVKSNYKYAQPKVSQIIIEDGNSYILGEDLATGNEMLVSDHVNEIEIIGNVHANPELLKG